MYPFQLVSLLQAPPLSLPLLLLLLVSWSLRLLRPLPLAVLSSQGR